MTMPKVDDSKIGSLVNCLLILGLFALSWYWGFQLAATALADPDTCWLLAVGKWILTHGGLPTSDPFSWTVGADAPPFLQSIHAQFLPYQWLASLIYFCIWQSCGASGLLYFACLLIVCAFLIFPLLLARRLQAPVGWQAVLSALAVSAGSFHFPLRPELFSYLLIAFLYYLLLPLYFLPAANGVNSGDATQASPGPARNLVAGAIGTLLFCFWANLHTGFVLGLLIVVVLLFTSLCCAGAQRRSRTGYMSCFSLGAVFGTLITPFQLKLYSYLPGLFFSPMNKYTVELMPLRFSELLSFDFLPYLALQVIFLGSAIAYCSNLKKKGKTKLASSSSSSSISSCSSSSSSSSSKSDPDDACDNVPRVALILGIFTFIAFLSGDMCRRMIPFAVLMSSGYFLAIANKTPSPGRFIWPLRYVLPAVLFFAMWGTQLSSAFFHAEIPMTTYGFDVPRQALAFIEKQRPKGNLLNDSQFGDVLIFALGEKARVFIDTRFDLYGYRLSHDYFVMVNALPGYEALLSHYKIDWIFMPPRARLPGRLSSQGGWSKIFEDKAAVIMAKDSSSETQVAGETTTKATKHE
ncbi:MAG: hypothetical protein KGS72_05310 [Cyanobacteria bacterium REEB67]|nr:hypothetical protein [Cyanobacteria bacterium REEB67]